MPHSTIAIATGWPSSITQRNSLFLQQIGTLESELRRVPYGGKQAETAPCKTE